MTEKPPKGLVGVVVVNSVFLLISLTGIGFQVRAGDVSPLTIFGAVMWLCLGPALLIKRPLTWRVGRTLIYAYVLGLAVLIMFAILHGALLHSTLVTLTEIMIVVYLIGVRGYLNSQAARLYYGVRPPGA